MKSLAWKSRLFGGWLSTLLLLVRPSSVAARHNNTASSSNSSSSWEAMPTYPLPLFNVKLLVDESTPHDSLTFNNLFQTQVQDHIQQEFSRPDLLEQAWGSFEENFYNQTSSRSSSSSSGDDEAALELLFRSSSSSASPYAFRFVNLSMEMKTAYLGSPQQDSPPLALMQAFFTGTLTWEKAPTLTTANNDTLTASSLLLPPVDSTSVQAILVQALRAAFSDAAYQQFKADLLTQTILADIQQLQITVNDTIVSQGLLVDAPADNKTSSSGSASSGHKVSGLTIAAAVVFGIMMLMLLFLGLLVYRQRKQQKIIKEKQREKSRSMAEKRKSQRSQGGGDPLQGSFNNSSSSNLSIASSSKSNSDLWMDEMTKQITSIPLRSPAKSGKASRSLDPTKTIMRPAARAKSSGKAAWLFCISEEDSVTGGDHDDRSTASSQAAASSRSSASHNKKKKTGASGDSVSSERRRATHRHQDSLDGIEEEARETDGQDEAKAQGEEESSVSPHSLRPVTEDSPHQFDDVDLAAPADYEHRPVQKNMLII